MNKKTVVLGVTGSIAAYKAADLCSKLVQADFNVSVIMTESACKLITAKTFLTLSQNPVITDLWQINEWRPGHIALAEQAQLFVVAPCTANFIGKFANWIADDALSTYALSHTGKFLLAPAMNPAMWSNQIVQKNVSTLKQLDVEIIGPAEGRVACGCQGTGRMESVETIVEQIKQKLFQSP